MGIPWRWLGRVDYARAWSWQQARRAAVIAGGSEVLALLEHDPVVTTGRRPVEDLDGVRAAGIPVIATERGGLATWHGPGQLVGYPIVDIGARGIRVKAWMGLLETAIAGWLRERGVDAAPRPGMPGVWVGDRKLCAVGTHVARGVTLHGFALNLLVDPAVYATFTPCGLVGFGVTSAEREGLRIAPAVAAPSVAAALLAAVDTATRPDYLTHAS